MAIVTRTGKGSALTHAEVDNNFTELDNGKMNKSQLGSNSSVAIKDSGGNLGSAVVGEDTLVGRLSGGEILGLTVAQVLSLLSLDISKISGLSTALAAKADVTSVGGHVIQYAGQVTLSAGGTSVDVPVPGIVSTDVVIITQVGAGGSGTNVYVTYDTDKFTVNVPGEVGELKFNWMVLKEVV